MLRIIKEFKDELYGGNMCYYPDGTVGPKNIITNRQRNSNTFSTRQMTSRTSSLGKKAMN